MASMITSKRIDWSTDPNRTAVEDMGIDHLRRHIAVAQEFLHPSDIVTTLQ